MSHWGTNAWMAQPTLFPSGTGATPLHADVFPQNGASTAERNTPIRFVLFADPLPDPVTITVNGVQVFDGTQYTNGYRGKVRAQFGRRYYMFRPTEPFAAGQRVDVATSTGLAWTFTTQKDTSAYSGNALLDPERWMLQPFDRFLDFEPVRQIFLQHALTGPTANHDNVAVRVLYQLAFDTEISSVLNPLFLPDMGALEAHIPLKRSTLELDALLEGYSGRLEAGLEQLISEGALSREHRNSFADYRTSMLYTYRVSAAAVLLFFARNLEAALNASSIDNSRVFTINGTPLTVDGSLITL